METKTMTKEKAALIQVVDSFDSAVEMLDAIASGKSYPATDYHSRVILFKLALRNVKREFGL